MGFFSNWPFSNLHNLNLDWLIEQVKKLTVITDQIWDRVKPIPGGDPSTITAAQAYNAASLAQDTADRASQSATTANTSINNHTANKNNPHNVTAQQVGAEPTIGILDVSKGGTGGNNPVSARASLGARADFTILPVSDGGTGSSTPAGARDALGITPANIGAKPDFDVLPVAQGGTGSSNPAGVQPNLGLFIDNGITAADQAEWKSKAQSAILASVRSAGGICAGNVGWNGHDFCYFIAWRIYKPGEYDRCAAIINGTGNLTGNTVQFWSYNGNAWDESRTFKS